jgi:tryptophanyl-tRNA synthetase
MAADILLYSADEVPVGEDQKQHVELARDIATRFNNLYGEVLMVPQPQIQRVGGRVMSLQDPASKMSKSDPDQSGCLLLLDDEATIRTKIGRAVTDSGSTIEASDDKPAISNLLQIYAGITDQPIDQLVAQYAGKGYGAFKDGLADAVVQALAPIQERYYQLVADPDKLTAILEAGSQRASAIAEPKLAEVQRVIGLR